MAAELLVRQEQAVAELLGGRGERWVALRAGLRRPGAARAGRWDPVETECEWSSPQGMQAWRRQRRPEAAAPKSGTERGGSGVVQRGDLGMQREACAVTQSTEPTDVKPPLLTEMVNRRNANISCW